MKLLKTLALALLLLLLLAQLVRPERSNPPVGATLDAPEEVLAILRRSCFDCHSNETAWPWYSAVAPASWLVAHDVEEGRKHLNFSTWGARDAEGRRDMAEEIVEEVGEGEMPLWQYLLLHGDAELDARELGTLRKWAESL